MAKISEMGPDELKKYIKSYEKKVAAGGEDVVKHQKTLAKLKQALESFSHEDDTGVQSFHSSDVDYSSYTDAGFGARAIAVFIDGILLGVLNNIILFGIEKIIKTSMPAEAKIALLILNILVSLIVPTLYAVYFLKKDGQTLGKKLMKIKVIYQNKTDGLTAGSIIMRESIGKMLSSLVFGLGFIVRLFGYQTWHDKISNTRVISMK